MGQVLSLMHAITLASLFVALIALFKARQKKERALVNQAAENDRVEPVIQAEPVIQDNHVEVDPVFQDDRKEVDYDLVILPSFNPFEIKVEAIDLDRLKKLCGKYPVRTLAVFGDRNVGKTFILGALFNLRFVREKMTLSTYGLSFYLVDCGDGKTFLLMDFEGTNAPIECNEENMRERFSQEHLLEKISMIYGYYLLYVMNSFTCENVKKIMALRRRAFKQSKKILIVLNWKEAKTLKDIEALKETEIIKSFNGNEKDIYENHIVIKKKAASGLSEASIYYLGNNNSDETRAFNKKVFEGLKGHISGESFCSDYIVTKILRGLGFTDFVEIEEDRNREEVRAHTKENGSDISEGELLESLFDNFSTERIQIDYIEEGEEDENNLPFKIFKRMKSKENIIFLLKGHFRTIDQNVYFFFEGFENETYDIYPETRNDLAEEQIRQTRNFVTVLHASGFTTGRNIPLGKVPQVDDFVSNTFTFSIANSGYKVMLHAKRSDEGLRKSLKRTRGLIVYSAEYYNNSKYKIMACDFKYGLIYLWFAACGKDGNFDKDSLECVQNKRISYFQDKEKDIPEDKRTPLVPIFICDESIKGL